MDLDVLQTAAFAVLDEAVNLDKLPAMDRAFKAIELRAKLRGLFPKSGADAEEMPTGPIRVELTLIDAGNRQLVQNGQEEDVEDDIIEVTDQREPQVAIERRVHI
jgi:hypothetical protein